MPEIQNENNAEGVIANEVIIEEDEVEMVYSEIQDMQIPEADSVYVERSDSYVTQAYFDENIHHCANCGDNVERDDFDTYEDECNSCVEYRQEMENNDDDEERQSDTKSINHQSTDSGKYIKSQRKFGVEIECGFHTDDGRRKAVDDVSSDYGFVHDGSINCDYGIECVSPILQGKKGEESLIKTIDILNSNKVYVDNSCGLHVHLDGSDYITKEEFKIISVGDLIKSENKGDLLNLSSIVIQKEVLDYCLSVHIGGGRGTDFETLSDENKQMIIDREVSSVVDKIQNSRNRVVKLNGKWFAIKGNEIKLEDGNYYISLLFMLSDSQSEKQNKLLSERMLEHVNSRYFQSQNQLDIDLYIDNRTKIDKKDYLFMDKGNRQDLWKVRNAIAFYHVFSDVILSMLPTSRRNNEFCRKITDKFTLKQLNKCDNLDDLLKLWYESTEISNIKNSRMKNKYDDSRYYGVNFHSLFKNGTIEIRYHSGTTNKNKILFWIHLHQTILDKIVTKKITSDQLERVSNLIGVNAKLKEFFKLLKLPPKLESYVKTRISHLNNVSKQSLDKFTTSEEDEPTN